MIEVEVEPEEMDSVHDSRMITQDISEDEADMQGMLASGVTDRI